LNITRILVKAQINALFNNHILHPLTQYYSTTLLTINKPLLWIYWGKSHS